MLADINLFYFSMKYYKCSSMIQRQTLKYLFCYRKLFAMSQVLAEALILIHKQNLVYILILMPSFECIHKFQNLP